MAEAFAPVVGEQARPFGLVDLDGRRVRLDDLRGSGIPPRLPPPRGL
jgi:hypothetical protein